MIRSFLKNLGIALAIASTLALIAATLALPFLAFMTWLEKPWAGVCAVVFAVGWFCVFMAAIVTLEEES